MKKIRFSDVERLIQDVASLLAILTAVHKLMVLVARWYGF